MSFSVYVDESGESGIIKVRSKSEGGASPYFVLGAAVFQPASEIHARRTLAKFKDDIGKKSWKHATDLDHAEKVYFARLLKSLHVRFFAVISNKSTLGEYKSQIAGNSQKFYNKCVLYLLEKVCAYLSQQGASADDIRFILEERNHDYDAMLRYFNKVKDNPIYPESKALCALNPFAISTRKKGEEDLLEIADFVSHAVYQCTNKTDRNFFIPETRYFQELSSRFAADQRGNILGVGLKCIHDLQQLELDNDVVNLFKNAKAPLPPRGA